jgi:copper chaperone NosL
MKAAPAGGEGIEAIMLSRLSRLSSWLDLPLSGRSRLLVVAAALVLIPTFFLPLWHMSFWAQQYPEGLELHVYSHALVGGDQGNDLVEINVLNHYIGMGELREENFTELKWIPLVIGLIGVLTLRSGTIGNVRSLLDVVVVGGYFGAFSMWSFWYKLNYYGKHLDPRAAVQVEPFTPPILGSKMVGQFEVRSYPASGTYLLLLFGLLLLSGFYFTRRASAGEEGSRSGTTNGG